LERGGAGRVGATVSVAVIPFDPETPLPTECVDAALPSLSESAEPPGPDAKAEVARLARLSPIQYDRERQPVADRLGCRVAALDAEVKAARGRRPGEVGQGRPLELPEPDPWPEPVRGAELLDQIACTIRSHVVLDSGPRDAVALWCLAVHAFKSFDIYPRLFLTAPTKGAGKSTMLDTIEHLVPRPLAVSSASAAALFRAIPALRPVLLLDEADAWARDNEDVRAVLDAGHKRGAAVLRCVGDDNEPRVFDVFAPAVLAAIGHLPDTIEDRSIIVSLRRKLPDEAIKPLRAGLEDLGRLARRAARWAQDHAAALADAEPAMPAEIANRAADNWAPLLAVADSLGGDWPERARRAATGLTGGDDQSRGIMLLADIARIFGDGDRMSSEAMAERLAELEERPWPEYRNGRPITKAQLGRELSRFGIHSKSIRLDDGHTPKGYARESFADAWARYLPQAPVVENATSPHPLMDKGLGESSKRHNWPTGAACGVSEDGEDPWCGNGCGVVALAIPGVGEIDTWMLFQERAAIREYDGALPRAEAERLAALDLHS